MEKSISKFSKLLGRCNFLSSRVLPFSSTANVTQPSANYAVDKPSSLYKRISMAGQPSISMASILHEWVSEGHPIYPKELQTLILRLRRYNRFTHALQISEWMFDKHSRKLAPKNVGTHLELIYRVHGLDKAEEHFVNLSESLKVPMVYNALLRCCTLSKSLKKAEDLMQKIREIGFNKAPYPYQSMLKMYFQLEMYDKVQQILQEMEERGFSEDTFSDRIQLSAYSKSGKVKEMEEVLMKIESDAHNSARYDDYITAASGYLNIGAVDKSLVMLKKAEYLGTGMVQKHVYQCLLTLYARAKAKEEVFRLWNVYKKTWVVYNKGYLCMVHSLVMLDDLDGAETIIDGWANGITADKKVDYRVINPLIRAYCKKGGMERAQALIDKLVAKCHNVPKRGQWDILATGYMMHDRMEEAVRMMKKALAADAGGWNIKKVSISQCLDFLRMKGNQVELDEFMRLLEDCGYTADYLLHVDSDDNDKEQSGLHNQAEDDTESEYFLRRDI